MFSKSYVISSFLSRNISLDTGKRYVKFEYVLGFVIS